MKLEIGMYVRTVEGQIAKILDINTGNSKERYTYFDLDKYIIPVKDFDDKYDEKGYRNYFAIDTGNEEEIEEYIKSAGHNILDVIEVGDVVLIDKQRCQVYKDIENELRYFNLNDRTTKYLKFANIKSVITKEELHNREYNIKINLK